VREDDRVGGGAAAVSQLLFTGARGRCWLAAGILLLKTLHVQSVLEEIARHHGTILPAVPSFYPRGAGRAGVQPAGRCRLCISGGAPLPGGGVQRVHAEIPVPLREGYAPPRAVRWPR